MTERLDAANIPCPDCGGERVWAVGTGYPPSVKPEGVYFSTGTQLRPLVCTGCGLTLWYHPFPDQAVKKRPDKPLKDW